MQNNEITISNIISKNNEKINQAKKWIDTISAENVELARTLINISATDSNAFNTFASEFPNVIKSYSSKETIRKNLTFENIINNSISVANFSDVDKAMIVLQEWDKLKHLNEMLIKCQPVENTTETTTANN